MLMATSCSQIVLVRTQPSFNNKATTKRTESEVLELYQRKNLKRLLKMGIVICMVFFPFDAWGFVL